MECFCKLAHFNEGHAPVDKGPAICLIKFDAPGSKVDGILPPFLEQTHLAELVQQQHRESKHVGIGRRVEVSDAFVSFLVVMECKLVQTA